MSKSFAIALVAGMLAFAATPAQAQLSKSLGLGWATPQSDLDDIVDDGYTVRGQLGLSALGIVGVHAQAGWTHFGASGEAIEDVDIFHAALGGRVGMGLFFVGANAAYFFGDGEEEAGFFPEVGLSLPMFEVVADYNFTADRDWFAVRAALKL